MGTANVRDNIVSVHFLIVLLFNRIAEIVKTSVPLTTMPAIISMSETCVSSQISAPEIRVPATSKTLTGETLKYPN